MKWFVDPKDMGIHSKTVVGPITAFGIHLPLNRNGCANIQEANIKSPATARTINMKTAQLLRINVHAAHRKPKRNQTQCPHEKQT